MRRQHVRRRRFVQVFPVAMMVVDTTTANADTDRDVTEQIAPCKEQELREFRPAAPACTFARISGTGEAPFDRTEMPK